MDRFEAMRVFSRIVERRSFTKAAEDLGLPRSSVTDAVKGLEVRLGVMLLRRTTRQVSPTLDGEAHYRRQCRAGTGRRIHDHHRLRILEDVAEGCREQLRLLR